MSKTAEDYFNSGGAKAKLQDYRGAIQNFNKAIELNPNDDYSYNNRGLLEIFMKQNWNNMIQK